MDPDDWLQSPQPPTGSKRPSPSPSTGEDRETKKQRTQHCDNEDANRELPSREMPYRPVDFGEDGEVYSNESRAAFSVNVAYRDQFAISLADNDGGVSSFNNDIACGYPNTEHENESLWDVSTQKAFQGHEGHEGHVGTIASSEIGYSTDSATLVQPSKRTGAKDYLFKIEEPNSTGLASSYNDVNNAPLQGSAMQIQDESCDICCDYDTCFGVLMATPTSSFTPEDGTHTVPVKLKAFGDIFMLQTQTSCAHAGILSDSRLVNALTVFPLRIDATLLISEVEKIKGLTQSKSRKHTTEKSAPEYSLRIVIHGLRCDKEAISNTLSNANLFLQHPYASEVLPDVEYNNPHYLLRPGAEMPKVEDLHLEFEDDVSVQTGLEEESENDHLLRLLETAEADGGELTVVDTSPSPRLRHQVAALAFMLEKERGYVDLPMFPPLWRSEYFKDSHTLRYRHTVTGSFEPRPHPAMGGILADDTGLGKTLSVLALICSSLDLHTTMTDKTENRSHWGTLIVAPKSTIHGWQAQISQHIHEGKVRVAIYHGPGRGSLVSDFLNTDIVVTTYETVRSEFTASNGTRPLHSWQWLRIVLDEAHHIRNRSKQAFRSVCGLKARYRWCLTGTPVCNSLDDYGALLSFVGIYPFREKSKFSSWIVKPVKQKDFFGVQSFQTLVRATCLRRTKQKALSSGKLTLPPRSERTQIVRLHPDDQALYDRVTKATREKALKLDKHPQKGSSTKDKENNILVLLNFLRRICNHEQLLPASFKNMIEEGSSSNIDPQLQQIYRRECSACGGEINSSSSIKATLNSVCANCATSDEGVSTTHLKVEQVHKGAGSGLQSVSLGRSRSNKIIHRPSAKILALLENLQREKTTSISSYKQRKSVVFSYWIGMLGLIEHALDMAGIAFQRIDGQTSLEGRRKALLDFNGRLDCTVMLASIGSAAGGIDLTAASLVHLIEPHWNPVVEAQAIDLVHRIGQTQEVTVIRYIVPNSIETYVQAVQQEKLQIINQAINTSNITEMNLNISQVPASEKCSEWVAAMGSHDHLS